MTAAAIATRPVPGSHLGPLRYSSAAQTHAGCVRATNEDAFLDRPDIGLWAVADGMGGHDAGALASKCVIDKLTGATAFDSAFSFRRSVELALLEANQALQDEASRTTVGTIGATVVVLLVHGTHYACLWAGDSRAYLLRDGGMHRLTQDHTLAAELVNTRQPHAEVDIRRYAHVVTRAVGARPTLEVECSYGVLKPGDQFLLASDGLEIVDEKLVRETLGGNAAAKAVQCLIELALHNKAPDNVTAVVVEAITDGRG